MVRGTVIDSSSRVFLNVCSLGTFVSLISRLHYSCTEVEWDWALRLYPIQGDGRGESLGNKYGCPKQPSCKSFKPFFPLLFCYSASPNLEETSRTTRTSLKPVVFRHFHLELTFKLKNQSGTLSKLLGCSSIYTQKSYFVH